MFSTQLGNFPFATTKIKQDNSNSSNLQSRTMETNNGAGDSNQSQIDKTKLIVNYIPQFATEDDLAQIFAPVGRVESIKIMRDYKTGYSFGFGFVKYSTPEDAAKAIEVLNGYNFRNKRLKVSYSRPPGTDMKDSNLYITNLPKDITENEVDNLFRDYGEIVQRTVLKDKVTGMPRGVAFVRFSKGEEAQAAIANLHGKVLENAMLPLSVRVAEDHGRQKAQYLDVWDPMGFNREPEIEEAPDPEEILIEEIFHRKPLWDMSLPQSDRTQTKIENLWKEIVLKFENKYSLEFLIKKWRQLKETYAEQRSKLSVYVPGEAPPRLTFYYYEIMKFLDGEPTKFIEKSSNFYHKHHLPVDNTIEVKKPRLEEHKNDGVNGFLTVIEEKLRLMPLKSRTKVQIKILQILDEEEDP